MKFASPALSTGATGAVLLGAVILISPAGAQPVPNDLPIGTCVTAYGSTGRIVDTVQNGYRIRSDEDPNGTPFVAAASSTTRSACKTAPPIAPAAAPPALPLAAAPQPGAVAPTANANPGGSCFASSTGGLAGQARTYAGLIIGNWAAPAPPGSDGAVTVRVDTLRVGAARRATFWDRDNATLDPRAPVIPVVAKVTICTDYRTRIDLREVQENFLCYTRAVGGLSCGEVAHTADLPQPRNWSVDK